LDVKAKMIAVLIDITDDVVVKHKYLIKLDLNVQNVIENFICQNGILDVQNTLGRQMSQ
jgi:hypothetical protein